jgi:hypothetical protein
MKISLCRWVGYQFPDSLIPMIIATLAKDGSIPQNRVRVFQQLNPG